MHSTYNNYIDKEVDKMLKKMTLEEKAGQLFIIQARKNEKTENLYTLDNSTANTIKNLKPGGIILFGQNIHSIPQVKSLITDMQAHSQIPLFMSIDQEGGRVDRLNVSDLMHASKVPPMLTLGNIRDENLTYKTGQLIGNELKSLGFNMDFAPVADINTNPLNPIIGARSFGSDPSKVAQMVIAFSNGLKNSNVIPVIKHFPGHGDTSSDTHLQEVKVLHNIDRLRSVEFIPFKLAIKNGIDCIMAAHIKTPNITKDNLPATLSPYFLTEILRKELNFHGVIFTDALGEMKAVTDFYSPADACIKSFNAGADILLIPKSFDEGVNGIIKQIKSGNISITRLNESVTRILKLKYKYGIMDKNLYSKDAEKTLGCAEHKKIIDEINRRSELQSN